MDWFLIIVIIILAIVLLGVNVYLLALYCHPEDSNFGSSLFCKILVIAGLALSWSQVLMLPLDVANSTQGANAGLDMQFFWIFIYMLIMIMVCILIPFATFLYEEDDDRSKTHQCFSALCYTIMTIFVICAVLFISFVFLRFADIPQLITTKSFSSGVESSTSVLDTVRGDQTTKEDKVELEVSFPIYCMAILAFIGWFLLAFFGGVGLSALPIDLIRDFFYRPRLISSGEARDIKTKIVSKTTELISLGEELQNDEKDILVEDGWWGKRKAKGKLNSRMKKFKVEVFNLENSYAVFKLELNYLKHNPLFFYGKLVVGCLFTVISFLWWLHILLFVCIKSNGEPVSPFLNDLLIGLQSGAGFLATGVFAFLSLYLLWCTTKGTLKVGLRLLCITIHPMKVNETWMNSFLFNIQLILLASVAVTQFCSKAFSQYARLTDIDLIFNGQIQYMRFFSWFNENQVFEWFLIVWSALAALYLSLTAPKRDGVLAEIDALRKQKYKG